jgi:hypothetical protein
MWGHVHPHGLRDEGLLALTAGFSRLPEELHAIWDMRLGFMVLSIDIGVRVGPQAARSKERRAPLVAANSRSEPIFPVCN